MSWSLRKLKAFLRQCSYYPPVGSYDFPILFHKTRAFRRGYAYNGRGGKLFGASRGGLTGGLYDPSPCDKVSKFIKLVCTPPYGTPPSVVSVGEASPTACCRPGLFCCSRFHIATPRTWASAEPRIKLARSVVKLSAELFLGHRCILKVRCCKSWNVREQTYQSARNLRRNVPQASKFMK